MGVYLCSMGINVGVVQNFFYDVLFVYDDDDLTSGAVGVHYLIVSGDIFSCDVNIPRRSRHFDGHTLTIPSFQYYTFRQPRVRWDQSDIWLLR